MLHVPRMQQNSRSSPFVVKVLMLFQYMSIRMPSQASDECRWVPMFFRAPQMTDHFWHTGPNGRHKCMTFEAFKITENGNHLWNVLQVGLLYLYPQVFLGLAGQVMGENLLALVKHYDYNGIPLDLCRRLSRPGSNCSPWFQWCSMSVFPHSSLTKLFGERCLAGIFAQAEMRNEIAKLHNRQNHEATRNTKLY